MDTATFLTTCVDVLRGPSPYLPEPGTIARGRCLFCNGTIVILALRPSGWIREADTPVDVVDPSHKRRGSVPVKNRTLDPATWNAGERGNGSRWIHFDEDSSVKRIDAAPG